MVNTYTSKETSPYQMKAKANLYFIEITSGVYEVTKDAKENYYSVGAVVTSQGVVHAFNDRGRVVVERLDGQFVTDIDLEEDFKVESSEL